MNKLINLYETLQDTTNRIGLILLFISLSVFVSTLNVTNVEFDIFTNVFFVNYIFTFIYFIVVVVKNKQDTGSIFRFSSFPANIILLQLFNISAYSLNRSIPIFNVSTDWLVCFLIISNGLLLIHALWRDYTPGWFNYLMVFIVNIAIFFHIYQAVYIGVATFYSILVFWFFGIPLHAFVPLLFVWAFIKVSRNYLKANPKFWASSLLGWVLALGMVTYTSLCFKNINDTIKDSFHETQKPYEDRSLPAWVNISQQLKKDWITERALKCGMAYTSGEHLFDTEPRGLGRFNTRRKHDPLVVIASFFSEPPDISRSDRIKILNYLFDARHETERKLWSGENLSTTDIVTNVQLFPDYRMAYTEKTFKIKSSRIGRWGAPREALYTFYLPEGSVVTSAALWVNGEERPAYLTTKQKADNAYKKIVGVERRDPLLLHWKEGNRVTVRVFPCTPDEDRQFKIGVSTPLQKDDDRLVYKNIDFKGPYWKGAKETINVVTEGPLSNISTPYSFREDGTNYSYSGSYQSDWSLSFDSIPISEKAFTFNGKSYALQAASTAQSDWEAKEIYLDINGAWSKKQFNKIWEVSKNKKVYVYSNNRMELVTDSNKKALFKQLQQQNYTLFPFHKIASPSEALVISQFNQSTPTLNDLKGSSFIKNLSTYFRDNSQQIRLFHIGGEPSPYLRTLKELRSFQYFDGTLDELVKQLKQNTFHQNTESEQSITNHYGDFQITETIEGAPAKNNGAPDHLMRVFVYNDLMREIGKNYFDQDSLANKLIPQAKEAYVVTPISSLVVLETQEDYDRFDIKKSENSLENASIGNSGAVPEPHEWVLILLSLSFILWLYYRK